MLFYYFSEGPGLGDLKQIGITILGFVKMKKMYLLLSPIIVKDDPKGIIKGTIPRDLRCEKPVNDLDKKD